MEVFALVGPSGTGKSHHAMEIADEHQISYIIDDGLLIHHGKKLAGTSAKAEATMVAAVKRAIFLDPAHADEMRRAIEKSHIKKLLILGTSEHMIDRIVNALGLPPIKQFIYIHEVVSDEEIALAQKMREEGKHVIPLPSIEVRKDLPTLIISPVVGFFSRKTRNGKKRVAEKSIVRPTFSQMGKVVISEHVFISLVQYLAERNEVFGNNMKTSVKMTDLGVIVLCETKVRYGTAIQQSVMAFQKSVVEQIEETTGLAVRSVNVRVSGIFQ